MVSHTPGQVQDNAAREARKEEAETMKPQMNSVQLNYIPMSDMAETFRLAKMLGWQICFMRKMVAGHTFFECVSVCMFKMLPEACPWIRVCGIIV